MACLLAGCLTGCAASRRVWKRDPDLGCFETRRHADSNQKQSPIMTVVLCPQPAMLNCRKTSTAGPCVHTSKRATTRTSAVSYLHALLVNKVFWVPLQTINHAKQDCLLCLAFCGLVCVVACMAWQIVVPVRIGDCLASVLNSCPRYDWAVSLRVLWHGPD
jgi:hypothetical protein